VKRVLLDVDGVTADFLTATLDTLVQLGGPRVPPEAIHTWDIFGSLPREWEDRIVAEWHKPNWCSSVPIYPGAREAVLRLRDIAEVVFVTTAMHGAPHWMWERDVWLRTHLNAGGRDIIFATAKHVVSGDVLVDDKASNVAEWHKHNPRGTAILWDRPYNRTEQVASSIVRMDSWSALEELVQGLP